MNVAEVYMWGTRIGAVMQENLTSIPVFNYDKNFLSSGIEIAPLTMPLNERAYSFPHAKDNSFNSLPGLLADSLPDKYGTKLIERYLADQGRNINSLSVVERLLYTGKRGMGALEYEPQKDYAEIKNESLNLNALVEMASDILSERESVHIKENRHTMEQIINIGTSAGGARAKAVVAWNPDKGEIRSGQIDAGDGYQYWLIKFDGVSNNKDHGDKEDSEVYTRIEYAYYLMAKAAGIEMNECRLHEESGKYHFMTRRFDRKTGGEKLHMQTLGALAHFDYNMPGAYSYEQAANVISKLELGQKSMEELFRRMVFNICMVNQDDHVKNISFLMNKKGKWFLAPAYDLTYSYDITNRWLAKHQMSVNGKVENITSYDICECGKKMNITNARMQRIINDVLDARSRWSAFAEQANIPEKEIENLKNAYELRKL